VFAVRDGRTVGAARVTTSVRPGAVAGRYVVTLHANALRRLPPGPYVVEARAGVTANHLGPPVRAAFRLR
jgi:hypothetical protein